MNTAVKVRFNGQQYNLPAWSISILPDCKTAVFNTATVKEPTLMPKMNPVVRFAWQSYSEDTNSLSDSAFTKDGLVEQLSMTWDKSDYLWYTTYVNIGTNDLRSGQSPQLTVYSAGHSMQVFVNGKSYGTGT
jgi:beta-galactosidase